MTSPQVEAQDQPDLLIQPKVVNIGLEEFFHSLTDQGAQVVHVQWSPPGGGDQEMIALLDELL